MIPSKHDNGHPRSGNGSAVKTKGNRSDARTDRSSEDHERMVTLMETVRGHLETQSKTSERMAAALERLADELTSLPDSTRKQTESLTIIAELLSADAAATKRIEESLSQVPRIADAQRETMVSMGHQLETARQTNEHIGGAVDEVRKAVVDLGEATGASTKTLQEIWSAAALRDERLGTLMVEQTRRLTWFACSAIGLAGAAALTAVIGLLL